MAALNTFHIQAVNTTVTLAADSPTDGRVWLLNPVASVAQVRLRKVYFSSVSTTALLTLTSPNFTVERMTFTGTPGAGLTACQARSSVPAQARVVTSSAGVTPTAGAKANAFQTHTCLTGIGVSQPGMQVWPMGNDPQEWVVLLPGQGVVIRQDTAGTLLDTRSVRLDFTWEEHAL